MATVTINDELQVKVAFCKHYCILNVNLT